MFHFQLCSSPAYQTVSKQIIIAGGQMPIPDLSLLMDGETGQGCARSAHVTRQMPGAELVSAHLLDPAWPCTAQPSVRRHGQDYLDSQIIF